MNVEGTPKNDFTNKSGKSTRFAKLARGSRGAKKVETIDSQKMMNQEREKSISTNQDPEMKLNELSVSIAKKASQHGDLLESGFGGSNYSILQEKMAPQNSQPVEARVLHEGEQVSPMEVLEQAFLRDEFYYFDELSKMLPNEDDYVNNATLLYSKKLVKKNIELGLLIDGNNIQKFIKKFTKENKEITLQQLYEKLETTFSQMIELRKEVKVYKEALLTKHPELKQIVNDDNISKYIAKYKANKPNITPREINKNLEMQFMLLYEFKNYEKKDIINYFNKLDIADYNFTHTCGPEGKKIYVNREIIKLFLAEVMSDIFIEKLNKDLNKYNISNIELLINKDVINDMIAKKTIEIVSSPNKSYEDILAVIKNEIKSYKDQNSHEELFEVCLEFDMPYNSNDVISISQQKDEKGFFKLLCLRDIALNQMHVKLCATIGKNIDKKSLSKEMSSILKENPSIGIQEMQDDLLEKYGFVQPDEEGVQ